MKTSLFALFVSIVLSAPSAAQEKPLVGLIPKASAAIKMDGKLDVPPGAYTLELTASDKSGNVITSRRVEVLHGPR